MERVFCWGVVTVALIATVFAGCGRIGYNPLEQTDAGPDAPVAMDMHVWTPLFLSIRERRPQRLI